MTYNEQVLYEIHPDIIRTITPMPRPESRNRMGSVSIVPPIMEFTKAQIVRHEGFYRLIVFLCSLLILNRLIFMVLFN